MRLLGLDPGGRRIGVAVSDELGLLARPLTVIERRSREADRARLASLIEQHRPAALVVGLPLLPSGEAGDQARYSERFAAWLGESFGLPVHLWNESYSSAEAWARRRERGRSRDRRALIDAEPMSW